MKFTRWNLLAVVGVGAVVLLFVNFQLRYFMSQSGAADSGDEDDTLSNGFAGDVPVAQDAGEAETRSSKQQSSMPRSKGRARSAPKSGVASKSNRPTSKSSTGGTDGQTSTGAATSKAEERSRQPPQQQEGKKVKLIALPILVTSRGSRTRELHGQALVTAFLSTWKTSVVPHDDIHYLIQIGYDAGDPLYDNADNQRTLSQLIDEATSGTHTKHRFVRLQAGLADTIAMWNELVRQAYEDDNADYFYPLHDDTRMVSKDWAPLLIRALETGTAYPGLGVIGSRDRDSGFEDCGPYPFIGRLHLDIFGAANMHPSTVFRNHGGEVYLCALYRNFNSSFVVEEVVTRNHQDIATLGERYMADSSFVGPRFENAVRVGTEQVLAYIKKHRLQTRFPVPVKPKQQQQQ